MKTIQLITYYIILIYKRLLSELKELVFKIYGPILFYINNVQFKSGLQVLGIPKIVVTRKGNFKIGKNFRLNSGNKYNLIGRNQQSIFCVSGKLEIGNNCGMSSVAIVCHEKIIIGDNVMVGGNTVIYDTDFHTLDAKTRGTNSDLTLAKKKAIVLQNNVFIGAHTTILKGVTIGQNSIIGACSVISKDIPPNEIWGGNPAKFIKENKLVE